MNVETCRTTSYTDLAPREADDYAEAHAGYGTAARYYHSRLFAVTEQLRTVPGGRLLDVGCGPGVLAQRLRDTRPGDFTFTGLDQSPAMIESARHRLAGVPGVDLVAAPVEHMPLPDASFDVVVAMGVLEYTDLPHALAEMSRVTRAGGLVVTTMLNPASPYRLFEWGVYWPAVRLLGRVERLLGRPEERRHHRGATGIRALTVGRLRSALRRAGLEPGEVVYYDVNVAVPPLDRLVRRVSRGWRADPGRTLARGPRRLLASAYLVTARKPAGT